LLAILKQLKPINKFKKVSSLILSRLESIASLKLSSSAKVMKKNAQHQKVAKAKLINQ